MADLTETDDLKYEEDIKKNAGVVLVLFKSEWCPSCKRLFPVFEKTAGEYKDKAKFIWTDAVKNMKIATEYGVLAIPTPCRSAGSRPRRLPRTAAPRSRHCRW